MATEREIETTADALIRNIVKDEHYFLINIVTAAARYWEGIGGDFCLQGCNGEIIVFGGTNRLIYSPRIGFQADRSYCSERFLANYDRLGPLPGRK